MQLGRTVHHVIMETRHIHMLTHARHSSEPELWPCTQTKCCLVCARIQTTTWTNSSCSRQQEQWPFVETERKCSVYPANFRRRKNRTKRHTENELCELHCHSSLALVCRCVCGWKRERERKRVWLEAFRWSTVICFGTIHILCVFGA